MSIKTPSVRSCRHPKLYSLAPLKSIDMDQPTSNINDLENEKTTNVIDTQTAIEEVLPENTMVTEPILTDNPNRFVLFPIEHDDIWAEYKKQEASIWTAEEIDLSHLNYIVVYM